jgi:F0F1-type ATP synthase membrane subunit c/vacuolar-type H+-ATPase subunit K
MNGDELLAKNKTYYRIIVVETFLIFTLVLGFLLYKC